MARQIRDPYARLQIVDAARRVVAATGLQGTTMRSVAAEAGVSTGSITHYFADKRQLLAAVVDLNNQRAGDRALVASRSRRGLEAIAATLEELLPVDEERRLEWAVWVAFWTGSSTDSAAGAALHLARSVLAAILTKPFADAIEDGSLPAGLDVPYETERLIVMASGLGLLVNVSDPELVRPLARRMLADHLAQIAARPTPT